MTTTENIIVISQTTMDRLREAALRRGMKSDDYAEELLTVTLAALMQSEEKKTKRFNASQFRGIAPTGRSAAEIDAELNAARDEWDNREK